jgi:hypothetical protein
LEIDCDFGRLIQDVHPEQPMLNDRCRPASRKGQIQLGAIASNVAVLKADLGGGFSGRSYDIR